MRQNKTIQENPETEEDRKKREDYAEFCKYLDKYERAFDIARKMKERGQIQRLEKFSESMARQIEALPRDLDSIRGSYGPMFWILAGKEEDAKRVVPGYVSLCPHVPYVHKVSVNWMMSEAKMNLEDWGFPEYWAKELADYHKNHPQGEAR